MRIHRLIAVGSLVTAALVAAPHVANAAGGDGQTPAVERVCDDAGLQGAAFGLCVAFCEAQDCDLQPNTRSCRQLRQQFVRAASTNVFPCELPPEPAPGPDDSGLGDLGWAICFGEYQPKPAFCFGF